MKDPAVLWYWNDWGGGTRTFTRHLKGCYIDLLEAQFNSGPLSLEEIKTVLGTDFAAWGALSKKFKYDEKSGLFFNERMEVEKAKRKAYGESRRNNRKSKDVLTNVYIIRDTTSGYFKIGASTDPIRRLYELKNYSSGVHIDENRNYELLFFAESAPATLEFDIQTYFKKQVIKGEWFELSNDDLKFIKNDFFKNHMIKHMNNHMEIENENENRNEIIKEGVRGGKPKRESKIFIIPTLAEVKEYCHERNNNVDPEKWFNFYTAKGWMIGKNKMKDWKAAVRTWEDKNNGTNKSNSKPNDIKWDRGFLEKKTV